MWANTMPCACVCDLSFCIWYLWIVQGLQEIPTKDANMDDFRPELETSSTFPKIPVTWSLGVRD